MPKRKNVGEQLALGIGDDAAARGRVERAVHSSILAAAKAGAVDAALDAGLLTLARALAASIDKAGAKPDPYGVATASRELREVMARLKLDPLSRAGGAHSELAALLEQMSKPGT